MCCNSLSNLKVDFDVKIETSELKTFSAKNEMPNKFTSKVQQSASCIVTPLKIKEASVKRHIKGSRK